MRLRALALPTLEEARRELPELLAASGELSRRPPPEEEEGRLATFAIAESLSPAFGNPDIDPDLEALPELERAFIERQIERTRRDDERRYTREWPWVLTELSLAPLWAQSDDRLPHAGVIYLEVPVFTTDRCHATLRGQRYCGGEDFAYWLRRTEGRWTST